jgi:hypothetical protein
MNDDKRARRDPESRRYLVITSHTQREELHFLKGHSYFYETGFTSIPEDHRRI